MSQKMQANRTRCRRHATVAAKMFGLFVLASCAVPGCGRSYRQLRIEGQRAMANGAFGPARVFFIQADDISPRRVENLHDLGACSVMLAKEKFKKRQHAPAMRELDAAVAYYTRAIDTHPGNQASIEGKNVALKLKGQFDKALKHAEWAAEFVGPSARQYVFLAGELSERGDIDGAYLRFRQAVAVEPNNVNAHRAFAKFLLQHDNEPAAVFHLQAAYQLDPTNEWVVAELSQRGQLPTLTSKDEDESKP